MDGLGLWPAFVAGLAASGHCASMCGGIAGALSLRDPEATAAKKFATGLAYNVARVGSYAIAGAIIGVLGHLVLHAFDIGKLALVFRIFAGAIMIAVAGRLLFGWRLLDPLEAAGASLWRKVLPWTGRQGRAGGIGGAIGLGLAWGWLPCGMTYSMLMMAGMTGGAADGALLMAAFGAGTLPSMLTATVAFERVARAFSRHATMRNVAGVLLLVFGLWTAGDAIYMSTAGGGAHHHAM
jgi:sulfite exporter TauE/SafE